jgi:hypothetical protein
MILPIVQNAYSTNVLLRENGSHYDSRAGKIDQGARYDPSRILDTTLAGSNFS